MYFEGGIDNFDEFIKNPQKYLLAGVAKTKNLGKIKDNNKVLSKKRVRNEREKIVSKRDDNTLKFVGSNIDSEIRDSIMKYFIQIKLRQNNITTEEIENEIPLNPKPIPNKTNIRSILPY